MTKCVEVLKAEQDRLSNRSHLNRRRSSLHYLSHEDEKAETENNSRRKSVAGCFPTKNEDVESDEAVSPTPMPTVVLTPESPRTTSNPEKTLFNPVETDEPEIYIVGKTSSITASCLDIETEDDILNNNVASASSEDNALDNEDKVSVVSSELSTTTLSRGELQLVRRGRENSPLTTASFTTISRNTLAVNNANNALKKTSTTYKKMSTHYHSDLCPENPFRKVFAKRKAFYQSIGEKEVAVSSVNRLLWRKRHCTLCCAENRACSELHREVEKPSNKGQELQPSPSKGRITLNANIQPFAPFTITHDGNADEAPEVLLKASSTTDQGGELARNASTGSDLFKTEVSRDGNELRYATSTINSEDGLESHLEISVGQDGSSVITTRHKRLGSPSEIANNAVLKVQYDSDGGKIFNIQHTQRKLLSPSASNINNKVKANSAYNTATNPMPSGFPPGFDPYEGRYNSLPNLYGGRGVINPGELVDGQWLYVSHPADEQKRLAFTRGDNGFTAFNNVYFKSSLKF